MTTLDVIRKVSTSKQSIVVIADLDDMTKIQAINYLSAMPNDIDWLCDDTLYTGVINVWQRTI